MTLITLLILYIVFRFKHFICDFMLQSDWMALNKGAPGREGYHALFSHTVIHSIATLLILLAFSPSLWWLAVVDLVVHSIIDRTKGVLANMRGWTHRDTIFWWAFGADQELHNFTHLVYIVVIVMHKGGLIL